MAPSEPKAVLDARRFGRTPVVFIAGLGVCSLIALVALLAVVRGGPVPALAGLALALLPVLVVLAGILALDRFDPEPRALLAAMFGAGAGVAALIALAGYEFHSGAITTPELGPHAGRVAGVTLTAAIGVPWSRSRRRARYCWLCSGSAGRNSTACTTAWCMRA